jgi:hypothetical protein
MVGRTAALISGLALVFAAGACATTTTAGDGTGQSPGTVTVHPYWESCAAATGSNDIHPDGAQDALSLPRLDDRFQPAAAVVCRSGPQRRPSGGSDLVALEERAEEVAALVAALRLPDEKPTDGACTMELQFVPWLALLDAQGRWVRPGVPVDGCGKPRPEFRTAYERLRTKRVTTRVLGEIESDAAVASGCSQTWADMVWVTGRFGGGQGNVPDPLAADNAQVRVCIYRVPGSEQGSGKPRGDFQSGGKLAPARWAAIRRELTAAGPASACTTPSSRFGVLHPPSGLIYVEADGCRRVLIDDGTGRSAMRQSTAELTSSVFGR